METPNNNKISSYKPKIQDSAKSDKNNYSNISYAHLNQSSFYQYVKNNPNHSKMNISQFICNKETKERSLCDPIYGQINIPGICWDFIDKFEFQRLRNLKQLGNAYHVFPGATHTRFEHCIGTAHLANVTFGYLSNQLAFEMEYEPEEIRTKQDAVALSGLLHDIGHGPFSHLFDTALELFYENAIHNGISIENNDYYNKSLCNEHYTIKNLCEHEYRSSALIDFMIDKYNIDLEVETVHLIKNLILGGELQKLEGQKEEWMYQIVANKQNSIDVDKFDYLKRDTFMIGLKSSKPDYERIFKSAKIINDNICYNIKNDNDILNLFQTRYKQYKSIYYHKTTASIDIMIRDAFIYSNSYFDYLSRLSDLNMYCTLDDKIIDKMLYISNNISLLSDDEKEDVDEASILKAGNLIKRIESRDLYPMVIQKLITSETNKAYLNIKPEDLCIQGLKPESIVVSYHTINYGNKDRNPFDSINFYKDEDPNNSFHIQPWKSSMSVPSKFQEKFLRIYCKEKEDYDLVNKGYEAYTRKIIGKDKEDQPDSTLLNKKRNN